MEMVSIFFSRMILFSLFQNSKNISKKEELSQDTSSKILIRSGVAPSRSLNNGPSVIYTNHCVAPTHRLSNGISMHTSKPKRSSSNVVAADIPNNFGNAFVSF